LLEYFSHAYRQLIAVLVIVDEMAALIQGIGFGAVLGTEGKSALMGYCLLW